MLSLGGGVGNRSFPFLAGFAECFFRRLQIVLILLLPSGVAVGGHLADLVLGSLALLFDLGELVLLPLVTLADLLVPLLVAGSVLSGEFSSRIFDAAST